MKKPDNVHHFFESPGYKRFYNKVRAVRKIILFLDFDGTLVPIQKNPEQRFLSDTIKKHLLFLADSNCCHVMVLSGRSLSDIKKRVGIGKMYYGGNHGLDISGPDLRYTHVKELLSKSIILHVQRRLKKEIKNIEGAWIENKKYTVSLHFRSVQKENIKSVKKVFHEVVNEFSENKSLGIIRGKKVLELTPDVSWNKGSAALWMLKNLKDKCLPIYIGDDRTDETAFKALNRKGITIRIGKAKKTAAHYYLKGHWEVPRLLKEIREYTERFCEMNLFSK
jgi:trehalose 6-phosphate phosphatase